MVYNGTIFWCSKFSFNFHFPHPLGILINIFKHKFSTILNNSILFFQNVIGQVLHKGNMIFSFTFSCNSILIHTSLISFNTVWYNFYVNYINHLNPLFIYLANGRIMILKKIMRISSKTTSKTHCMFQLGQLQGKKKKKAFRPRLFPGKWFLGNHFSNFPVFVCH
jgi:hypothetical protein